MFRILVAEDDKGTRRLMQDTLADAGYEPMLAADGAQALELLEQKHVDLMVLDVMMPRMDGFELLSQLRGNGYDLPVLMLTAKEALADKRRGLRLGADDYMTKPADEEEMLLRIGALLRRAQAISSRRLAVGGTVLVYDDLAVRCNGRTTVLPRKEFQLLYKLLACPEKTFTRRQLMDEIWDLDTDSDEHTVNVHINRLRDRFRDNRDFAIVTVRGLGYKAVRL
ncbi:MAG TPA: response regulator transcription factor [Candidatus Gemmiger faecigallinarum]|nr:response regulator transcription factor [Candidatus Gemmiger faecigallinarum]